MIVLDASVAVEILLQMTAGAPLAGQLLAPDVSLHAPHLLDVEVKRSMPNRRRWADLAAGGPI